jgi:hypothetical protein
MKECPVAKKFKIKKVNECPNYVEGWWTPEGKDKPKIVHDCINKRILLMIQDLYGTTMNLLSENIRLNFERVLNQRIGRLGRVLEIENIGEGEKLDEAV